MLTHYLLRGQECIHSSEGDNSRTMQWGEKEREREQRKEGRKEGARDAEALIRGAGSAVNGPCEVKGRPMSRMRDGSRGVEKVDGIISI